MTIGGTATTIETTVTSVLAEAEGEARVAAKDSSNHPASGRNPDRQRILLLGRRCDRDPTVVRRIALVMSAMVEPPALASSRPFPTGRADVIFRTL